MPIDQNILLTVDAIILARKNNKDHILLIERGSDPFKGTYAFPGGFVEDDEDLATGSNLIKVYPVLLISCGFVKPPQLRSFC